MNNTREKKFFVPELRSRGNDLTKRWRVEYWAPTHNGQGKKRIVNYGDINQADTVDERTRRGYALINSLRFTKEETKTILDRVIEIGSLQWRPKTLSAYSTVLKYYKDFLGKQSMEMATPETITSFFLRLRAKKVHTNTIAKYRNTLYTLYAKAVKLNLTALNPVQKVEGIKRSPQSLAYFNDEQIKRLKEYIRPFNPQLWLAVQFLYYCFIRPGEMRLLKISAINFDQGFIEIPKDIAKNGKTEKVAIPQKFLKEIQHLKDYPNQAYILSKEKKPGFEAVTAKWINYHHSLALEHLKIKGNYAFYSWKHTGVVKCVQAGLNIRDIQNQLRHHSLDMVQEYLKGLGVLQSEDLKYKYPTL
jgi:integrase